MRSAPSVTDRHPRPFIKWAGGKEQLLGRFEKLWPERIERYVEPFLGSGAVFFRLSGRLGEAHLNDVNPILVQLYGHVRDRVEELIGEISTLAGPGSNTPEAYYRNREEFNALLCEPDSIRRSALFIYLNKTCFNGLFRVNARGLFNVPYGRYAKPAILDPERLHLASRALSAVASITSEDFEQVLLGTCRPGDFVYLDPPYCPVSTTADFTSYASGGFGVREQTRLAEVLGELHRRGVRWMLSNSCTRLTRRIFVTGLMGDLGLPRRRPYVMRIPARRAINSRADRRGEVMEYLIRNTVS